MLESQLIPKSSEITFQSVQAPMPVMETKQDFDSDLKISAEIATLLTNAKLLMKHGEYALALNILRQASNRDSHNPMVLNLLGDCLEQRQKLDEAIIVRKAAINVDYGYETVFKLANLLYKRGEDAPALEKYYDALALVTEENESLFEIYKNMGNIFVRQGDFDAAEEKYSKAFTMNSRSDVLLVNFGTLEVQRGDYDKSLYCFRQAVEANVNNDRAWVGLAMVHNQFGDIDLAWANVENALDIKPDNRTAVHLIANWAVRDHQYGKGIEALENYLSQADQDEEMSLVLINLYCLQGNVPKAQMEVERVLLWNPMNKEVRELRKKLRNMKEAAA